LRLGRRVRARGSRGQTPPAPLTQHAGLSADMLATDLAEYLVRRACRLAGRSAGTVQADCLAAVVLRFLIL
jgi:hypothetical protein